MATIFYSIAGEGNGHVIRAETIIRGLEKNKENKEDKEDKKHKIHLFSHGKGYAYLREQSYATRILGFHMYYINNRVSSFWTGLINMIKFPLMVLASLQYVPAFILEKPDVVITDFEPFVCYWAKLFMVPCISLDNQHSITHTKIDKIKGQWLSELYSKIVIRTFLLRPDYIIISSFFQTERLEKKQNIFVIPPIIKQEIIHLKPRSNGYIFVYQTSTSYKKLFSVLKKINKQFVIYGFNKELQEGNLSFRSFNRKQYFVDIGNADAVLINGGFTALSEALYLKKPVFAIPIKRQFEQVINGHYINKLQYGMAVESITVENFTEFLTKKEYYIKNIKKMRWDNNKKCFEILNTIITEYNNK